MQWYSLRDYKHRLRTEIELMERNGVNFRLCTDEKGNLLWQGQVCVLGRLHRDVRLVYPSGFPYVPIKVYVLKPMLPAVNHHIHPDGSICYLRPDEWSCEWTAYAVYLTVLRFLHDFYSGKLR